MIKCNTGQIPSMSVTKITNEMHKAPPGRSNEWAIVDIAIVAACDEMLNCELKRQCAIG